VTFGKSDLMFARDNASETVNERQRRAKLLGQVRTEGVPKERLLREG